MMRFFGSIATVLLLAALGCTGAPPATIPTSPSPSAAPSASPQGSAYFLEEFDGTALDPERWKLFEQSGIVLVKDGRLDLLNAGRAKNFPYMVTRDIIIPQRGPFTFELGYEVLATGQYTASFCLDYVPAEAPGEPGLATPFLRTVFDQGSLQLTFQTETGPIVGSAPNAGAPGAPHRLRVEFDGVSTYRASIDDVPLNTFSSKRRPHKFWVGSFEPKDYPENFWPRVALDRLQVLREAHVATLAPDAAASPAPAASGEGRL